jgi:hypothetical protein
MIYIVLTVTTFSVDILIGIILIKMIKRFYRTG